MIRLAILPGVCGRPGFRFLLPSYFRAISLRCQANSVSGVTIVLGAFGLGALLAQNPIWVSAARWAGAMYLFYLGGRMVVQAVQEASRKSGLGVVLVPRTAAHAVRLALGFALLNPHVYLDTVGLMGAASARYAAPARMLFVAGAAAASLLWFNFLVVVGV